MAFFLMTRQAGLSVRYQGCPPRMHDGRFSGKNRPFLVRCLMSQPIYLRAAVRAAKIYAGDDEPDGARRRDDQRARSDRPARCVRHRVPVGRYPGRWSRAPPPRSGLCSSGRFTAEVGHDAWTETAIVVLALAAPAADMGPLFVRGGFAHAVDHRGLRSQ